MKTIKRQINKFFISGVIAVAIDMLVYYLLLNFLIPELSKGISFIVGSVAAYSLNKYWTFEKPAKSFIEIIRFIFLYGTTLGLNVITNKIILDYTEIVIISFLIATGVSTIINFIGQKWWVFN